MTVPTSQTYKVEESPPRTSGLRVTITQTEAFYPRQIYIQWVLRNTVRDDTFTFNLYRSGSAEGPWENIGEDLVDTYNFIDDDFPSDYSKTSASLFSINRALYYKLEVTSGTAQTAETIKKLEPGLDRRRRGIHRKLVRDAGIYFKKVMGTEVAVFKRRWWGETCTECRSSTGQSTTARCGSCYGTGIKLGYWEPVFGWAQRKPTSIEGASAATDTAGTQETNRIMVYMHRIPQVQDRDVLVFLRDDRRYIIESVTPTQIHSVDVHQEVLVSELARSSVEYLLLADPWRDPPWF